MTAALSFLFFITGAGLAYWFWIQPLLRARPEFAEFYEKTDLVWAAVQLKFSSIKTKLAAVLLMVASVLIELHDFLLPSATGIDWTPVTSLVPSWAWPCISFMLAALFFWLRKVTARAQEQKLVAVEAGDITAAQAIGGDADAEVAVMEVKAAGE